MYLGKGTSINWTAYVRARVARILPLYYLTLFLYLPIHIYSMLRYGLTYVGKDYPSLLLSNLFMVSGIMDGWHHTFNIPAWSISVEFFCYLLIFPLLLVGWRIILSKPYSILISLILCLVFIRLLVCAYRMDPISIQHMIWNPSYIARGVFGFACGFFICGIYRLSLDKGWRPSIVLINTVVLASILIFVITRYYAGHLMLYAFPFLVLFTAYDEGLFAILLKLSPLQWLGERSYSLYLWHMPVLSFIAVYYKNIFLRLGVNPPYGITYLLIVVGSVFLISELSYRYFETACRDYIRNIGRTAQLS